MGGYQQNKRFYGFHFSLISVRMCIIIVRAGSQSVIELSDNSYIAVSWPKYIYQTTRVQVVPVRRHLVLIILNKAMWPMFPRGGSTITGRSWAVTSWQFIYPPIWYRVCGLITWQTVKGVRVTNYEIYYPFRSFPFYELMHHLVSRGNKPPLILIKCPRVLLIMSWGNNIQGDDCHLIVSRDKVFLTAHP